MVIRTAKQVSSLIKLIATDSHEVMQLAKSHGFEANNDIN